MFMLNDYSCIYFMPGEKRNIFVDMDGVLATWNPNAPLEEVACPGYFSSLPAEENVIKAVNMLSTNESMAVYLLAAVFADGHSIIEKQAWLDKHGVNIPISRRFFLPYGSDKSSFIRERTGSSNKDILIDDFSKNLHSWHGIGIKMYNQCNGTKGTWRGYCVKNTMPPDILYNQLYGIILTAT